MHPRIAGFVLTGLVATSVEAQHGVVTWKSTEPGPRTPVTRRKGQRQWLQVCSRVEGGLLGNLISWLKITLRGSPS